MILPIRDHNPSRRVPYVCWALIVANIAIFAAYWPLFDDPRALYAFFRDWALIPARLSVGEGWHTLASSMFLHGGVLHLAGNMLFLWIFGDNLEDNMGHLGFLLFYLAAGVLAAGAHYATEPFSRVPLVGASGAIAGVMGGYLLLYPRARVDLFIFLIVFIRIVPVPAWAMLGAWFAIQAVNAGVAPAGGGGVAHMAHAAGFVAGLVLTVPVWLARGGPRYWSVNKFAPPHPEAEYVLARSSVPEVPRGRGAEGQGAGGNISRLRPAAPGPARPSRVPTIRRTR